MVHAIGSFARDTAYPILTARGDVSSCFAGAPTIWSCIALEAGGVSYMEQVSDRANNHSVKGNLTWRF